MKFLPLPIEIVMREIASASMPDNTAAMSFQGLTLHCRPKVSNFLQNAPEIGARGVAHGSISVQKGQPPISIKIDDYLVLRL